MPTTIEDRLVVGDATVLAEIFGESSGLIHTINQQLVGAAADRLTQQVFVDSWRDRHDFDPSLGTVQNWLVRRARESLSGVDTEVEAGVDPDLVVDRLVVADSLARMDEMRREVVLAGIDATDVDQLAEQLDLPIATVNGHLRRGMDTLKATVADSRADGNADSLAAIMSEVPTDKAIAPPPEPVWAGVVAELGLAPGDLEMPDAHSADQVWSEDDNQVSTEAVVNPGEQQMAELRRPAEEANLAGPKRSTVVLLAIVLALVVLAVVASIVF